MRMFAALTLSAVVLAFVLENVFAATEVVAAVRLAAGAWAPQQRLAVQPTGVVRANFRFRAANAGGVRSLLMDSSGDPRLGIMYVLLLPGGGGGTNDRGAILRCGTRRERSSFPVSLGDVSVLGLPGGRSRTCTVAMQFEPEIENWGDEDWSGFWVRRLVPPETRVEVEIYAGRVQVSLNGALYKWTDPRRFDIVYMQVGAVQDEVVVYVPQRQIANICAAGAWGPACTNLCGRCQGSTTCDASTGSCPYGCQAGYIAPLCTQTCAAGTWGTGCTTLCGRCQGSTTCDATTGSCPYGCQTGYTAPLCTQACASGTWGTGCTNRCGFCRGGAACEQSAGACPLGCQVGYMPPLCTQVCSSGRWGDGCVNTCGRCQGGTTCSPTTGACPFGCQAGFQLPLCTQEAMRLAATPTVRTINSTALEVSAQVIGVGSDSSSVIAIIEYRPRLSGGAWRVLPPQPLRWSASGGFEVRTAITGLRPSTSYQVRVQLRSAVPRHASSALVAFGRECSSLGWFGGCRRTWLWGG